MRLFATVILAAAAACSGQDPNDSITAKVLEEDRDEDLTTKVFEHDRDKDGKFERRIETISRDSTAILRVFTKINDGVTNTSRSYQVADDLVMTESDDDGDGVFETIAIYHPAKSEMEVFTRKKDGSVQPVDAQTLAAYKRQNAAISDFWDKAYDTDEDNIIELIQETQKQIRDAEKEKTPASQ